MSRFSRLLVAILSGTVATTGAADAAGANRRTSATGSTVTEAAPCTIAYVWRHSGYRRFEADITITNSGGADIDGWTLGFTLPQTRVITDWRHAVFETVRGPITARNEADNGHLAQGDSLSVWFSALGWGTPIDDFTVNGHSCAAAPAGSP